MFVGNDYEKMPTGSWLSQNQHRVMIDGHWFVGCSDDRWPRFVGDASNETECGKVQRWMLHSNQSWIVSGDTWGQELEVVHYSLCTFSISIHQDADASSRYWNVNYRNVKLGLLQFSRNHEKPTDQKTGGQNSEENWMMLLIQGTGDFPLSSSQLGTMLHFYLLCG